MKQKIQIRKINDILIEEGYSKDIMLQKTRIINNYLLYLYLNLISPQNQ